MDEATRMPGGAYAPDADSLLRQAEQLIARRRWHAADQVLQQGLQLEPGHIGLLVETARVRMMQDRESAARELLIDVLRQAPGHVEARFLMFHVLCALGELPDAEQLIIALIREMPAQPLFFAAYARLMLRALEFRKARALVKEALHLSPDDREALHVMALCELVEGRGASQREAIRRLLTEEPQHQQTMHLVINTLLERGRTREAHRLARELLRLQPDDASALARVKALAADAHWLMWPLWPLQRWGAAATIGLWIAFVGGSTLLSRTAPDWASPYWMLMTGYVVYSWVIPPVVRWWTSR